jgi:hypothetical protein
VDTPSAQSVPLPVKDWINIFAGSEIENVTVTKYAVSRVRHSSVGCGIGQSGCGIAQSGCGIAQSGCGISHRVQHSSVRERYSSVGCDIAQ